MLIEKMMNVGFSGIKLELSVFELQAMAEVRQELKEHSLGRDDHYDPDSGENKNELSDDRQKELLMYFKNFLARIVQDTPTKDAVTAKLFGNLTDDDQYLMKEDKDYS